MTIRRSFVWLSLFVAIAFSNSQHCQAQSPKEQAELAQRAKNILTTNCHRCHGQEGAAEGGFNYLLDREKLVGRKLIVPANATQSRLFKRVAAGSMPPEDEKPRPTEAETAVLKKWIEAGAPDFNPPVPKRDFISTETVLKALRNDLEGLEEFDRKFTRYFTLTHLYNAGLTEEQLQTYRLALSKLVNSLSWGRRVVVPQSIDPAKTVFRIDLRHYGWNEKVWDRVVANHPYGIAYDDDVARACASMSKCRLPYVRGDWFVAAAAKPPLYHDVLQLPKTDKELENQLRVDVAENIRQRLVVRAGFNSSGVSQNNRLIERHESANGAYWKSYDFGGSADRQNLFARPLGPGGRNGFQADGGEIIFSLPNGLQGYLLVDAKGNRIDKGPTSIVSDPKRPDRAVVNGLSCMSCHNQGTIEKDDEVRKHVAANQQSYSKEEAETILAIYPPNKRLKEVLKEDADRFARAVEKTGGKLDQSGKIVGTDPVVALAGLFEQELDLRLAAAEVGVPVPVFAKSLERSPKLSRSLGLLNAEGGTVKRDAFVASFRAIVQELELGSYVTPDLVATGATASEKSPDSSAPAKTGAARPTNYTDRLRKEAITPSAAAKKIVENADLSEEAMVWMVMYVDGHRLRFAPLLDEADNNSVRELLAREDVKKAIAAEDARLGHPDGPTAPPIKQPARSAAERNRLRASGTAAMEATKKLMEKDGLSDQGWLWMVMYVNGHLLRPAPLLNETDAKIIRRILVHDELKKWIASEDAYAGAKK